MEHVTVNPIAGKSVQLVADEGFELVSKITGKKYEIIVTNDLKRWKVVEKSAKRTTAKRAKKKK